jgi:hypothetical protein
MNNAQIDMSALQQIVSRSNQIGRRRNRHGTT